MGPPSRADPLRKKAHETPMVSTAQPRSKALPQQTLEKVVIRFAGDSGDGMQLTGTEFTRAAALAGNDIATFPDFPAEIRAPAGTLAGVSGFQLHFASEEIYTPGDSPDVLVAMNPAALKKNLRELKAGGILIANAGAFTAANLKKVGYEKNPLEDDSLEGFQVFALDMQQLCEAAVKGLEGLGTKDIQRSKNFWALGLLYWLYNRDPDQQVEWIEAKFGKTPLYAEANVRVFRAGYNYGETTEVFGETYKVDKATVAPGTYRNIMGNQALVLGMVTAAQKAGLPLVLGSYPITPASDILHAMSRFRHYDVTTIQAEDEIAAMGIAIGASFGGALGMATTSGPGLALKQEALGLALIMELPCVVVNVQRGGPSTGLPTKTEQADLLQALYGRNGESPLPIIAAASPADCFEVGFEAWRIAIKYMTPVIVLSDGFIANGAEPWRLPKIEDIPDVPVRFRTDPEGYLPYQRDGKTLAREWVRPGTPGLAHRIGGLEKDFLTGEVSYDPDNHQRMCDVRAEKVQRVQQDIPPTLIEGDASADLLVVSWGGTYGSCKQAVARQNAEGKKVAHVHLRWLNPFPGDLGEVLRRYKRVLVCELNKGQLWRLLRAEFLVPALAYNKVQGQPFTVHELTTAIDNALADA
jgi:2-oxoglutarate/2-oxoacid ferredoxin oxidoreductase subunit alpha